MQHRRARFVVLLLLTGALSACGGGGQSAGTRVAPATLAITTQSLPGGSVGTALTCPPLEAVNVQGRAQWDVQSGVLPDGLALDSDGTISGTPTTVGSFSFVVRVRDDLAVDTQTLDIAIDLLGLQVLSGLVHGDAWTGRALSLSAAGALGSVQFSIETNESGAAFSALDPVAGTAIYLPGSTGGSTIRDVIRVTDLQTGQTADLDVSVMPDPTEQHTASFGSTDVWWIDPDQKFGTHAFASDLQKALADIGLRNPTSTGRIGTEADELASLWFRLELLAQVNLLFLRNADGSMGATGLAISFPFAEPGAGYSKPAAGSLLLGSPTRYSQMGLTHGSLSGVIGTAFLDGSSNGRHENDTNDADDELGVFANQITPIFNSRFGTPLAGAPVDEDDTDALRALLYGLPSPGGRYSQLAYVGRGFARTLAAVVAHEVGHSLSLRHTVPEVANSVMNSAAAIGPSATYVFTGADLDRLRAALPGAGKALAGLRALKAGSGLPQGGVVVCRCTAAGRHR